MEFPLPKPTQESFSKWFMKRVDNMDIVYGAELTMQYEASSTP